MSPDIAEVMADEINRHKTYPLKRHWTMDADYIQLHKHSKVLDTMWSRVARGLPFRTQAKPGRPKQYDSRTEIRHVHASGGTVVKLAREAVSPLAITHTCFYSAGVCRCGKRA
jgi:uncharacterized protein with von Willebrand factor type A (vWA) domain